MGEKKEEGWGFPLKSKKAHYFVGSRSLCNKWLFFGNLEGDDETSSDDCTTCTRQLAKRKSSCPTLCPTPAFTCAERKGEL